MRTIHRNLIAISLVASLCAVAHAACPPPDAGIDALRQMKAASWQPGDPSAIQALAFELLDCLADPNPELRDELAFDALAAWMRKGLLDADAERRIADVLLQRLAQPDDTAGFAKPFAALTLAEVARADRLQPMFTKDERSRLVDAAATYIASIHDYRGFDEHDGWRHAVAHGADVAMQLALNPALDATALDRLLDALAAQVLPPGAVFYHQGEGDRLARPVLFIARRGMHDAAFWNQWIGRIATAAMPVDGTPTTEASLARLHNAKALLWPMYAAVQEGQDDTLRRLLLPALRAALRQLP